MNDSNPGDQLEKAIEHAVREGATLAIPQVGRMVSNVHFMGRLLRAVEEVGLQFICLDNPTCNPQTAHILAAVAQEEAIRRSQRTKDVMARLRAEGKPLGSARLAYQWLIPEIKARRERGDTMDEIAKWLNDQGKDHHRRRTVYTSLAAADHQAIPG